MKCSYFLADPEYLPITYPESYVSSHPQTYSYGGNQNCFFDPYDLLRNSDDCYRRVNGGCGMIAGSDLFLYLQKNGKIRNLSNVDTSKDTIDWEEYRNYVVKMDTKGYFSPSHIPSFLSNGKKTWGIPYSQFLSGLKKYSSAHGLDLHYDTCKFVTTSREQMIETIASQLDQDIPVPLFLGLLGGGRFRNAHTGKTTDKDVNWHYVMITGFCESALPNCELTFSSWGKKYTISYSELENDIDSRIIQIR